MNAEIFAEWLRSQGGRVLRTPSSYWCEASPRVYQAFPYHWLIEPSEQELRELLVENNAIALRYSAPLDYPQGKVSYHVVCQDPAYDLPTLNRQSRQNAKKGLKYAHFEQIPVSRLTTEGWKLRLDTLKRQGREGMESEEWWQTVCSNAESLPGFEAWGAIHDGELVASFLAFICDDHYTLPFEQSSSAHLKHRINNAIFFSMTQTAIRRPGISEVFFCLHSLDAPESVDQFKLRMGLTAKPVRQRVVFHPVLAPFFNPISHMAVEQMAARNFGGAALAKAEGMIRFYLDGKRPPRKQDWPECLADQKVEMLETIHDSDQAWE